MTEQKIEIITSVGSSSFTIPEGFPRVVYLDIYGKSYKISSDGEIELEEVSNNPADWESKHFQEEFEKHKNRRKIFN